MDDASGTGLETHPAQRGAAKITGWGGDESGAARRHQRGAEPISAVDVRAKSEPRAGKLKERRH